MNTIAGDVRRRRDRGRCANLAPMAILAGCSSAPSQNILGSYFPSWMICGFAGIGATLVIQRLLVVGGLDKTLPVPLVVYLALVIAFSFGAWLIWLG